MENYVLIKAVSGNVTKEYKTKQTDGDKDKPITWNETLNVAVTPGPGSYLELKVMDQDTASDDVCGVGRLNLQNCGAFQKGVPMKFNVQLHKEKTTDHAGTLHLTTLFK